VGRTSAVIDRNFIEFQGSKCGFFAFFECLDDKEAATALIQAARDWLREHGMDRMIGPTAPSTNDTMGVLLDSYDDPPTVMMPYNPPYYPGLLAAAGLVKDKDLYAYVIDAKKYDYARFDRVTELVKKRHGISIRHFDTRRLAEETQTIIGIYNEAWERNWGFVPWTDEETQHLAREMKRIGEPELVFIAYNADEPIAFSLTLPDVYQALIKVRNGRLLPFGIVTLLRHRKRVDRLRVLAFGVKKQYRNLGLDGVLVHESYKAANRLGFKTFYECSWILEDNLPMRRGMERMGARLYKTYRVYGGPL
jgi:GNAT superfamily N-acetyltransferase